MSDAITRNESLLKSIADGTSSSLKPITREEQYLAYIAGETNSFPLEPITREEAFLDKIAKNGAGGGGSSINVQPLTVTENGTFDAPEGQAYDPVIVNVASGGGAELNIVYGDTAPEDTSKLWIKTSKPSELKISSKIQKTEGENLEFTKLETVLNSASYGTRAVSAGSNIYLFGGYGGDQKRIERFNSNTQTVETLTCKIPQEAVNHSCVLIDNQIYIFGCSTSSGNLIYCFDVSTETISTLPFTLSTNMYTPFATVLGNRIYYYSVRVFYCVDIETQTTTTLSVSCDTSMNAGVDDGKGGLYLFGENESTNAIRYFDAKTQTFSVLTETLPTTSNYGVATAMNGSRIYLFGGRGGSSNYDNTNLVRYFDTETRETGILDAELSLACCMGSAATVGETTYVFGGNTATSSKPSGTDYLNTIHLLAPDLIAVLDEGKVQILSDITTNTFNLINTDTAQVEIGVNKVYKGNADGIAEEVEAALHNGTSWVTI